MLMNVNKLKKKQTKLNQKLKRSEKKGIGKKDQENKVEEKTLL